MIVAANIGVADEVELIERQLCHLKAIGVDRIVVTDTGSTDGTAELLQAYADRGEIDLLRTGFADPDAFEYANRMLQHTLQTVRPDWILFADADEFHIPRTGHLHDVLGPCRADVLRVDRFNVPVTADGVLWPDELGPAGHAGLHLVVRQIADFEAHLQASPETPWILGRIAPKIVARADAVRAGISQGAHRAVRSDGRPVVQAGTRELLIAHIAVSSRRRFLRKLDNIREVFARFGDRYTAGQAWHWRRWQRLAEAGLGDEEFERQVFDAPMLADLRAAGTVCSAADWFAARTADAAPG